MIAIIILIMIVIKIIVTIPIRIMILIIGMIKKNGENNYNSNGKICHNNTSKTLYYNALMPLQLDTSRCVVAQPTFGAVPGVVGPGHHLLLCPPHMIAAAISWGASGPTVICCLLY